MNVFVKFLAFPQRLPQTFTKLRLSEHSGMEDLFRAVEERWGDELACGENRTDWRNSVMAAANGRMLRADEPLSEDQEVTLVGMILGG